MPEPTQMNMSFSSNTGEPSLNSLIKESQGAAKDVRVRTPRLSVTLKRVVKWIEDQDYDDFTKQELIKVAKSYPVGALNKFRMTARNHLARIQEKKRDIDRQGVVKKEAIDIDSLKDEERKKALEYKILRAQQKAEEDAIAAQQQEDELRKLAAARHSEDAANPQPQQPQQPQVQAQPEQRRWYPPERPQESQQQTEPQRQPVSLDSAMHRQQPQQQQPPQQPQEMPTSGTVKFGPPPEINKTAEQNKAAMDNRRAFALKMKQLADEEDQGDNFSADEDWMNE